MCVSAIDLRTCELVLVPSGLSAWPCRSSPLCHRVPGCLQHIYSRYKRDNYNSRIMLAIMHKGMPFISMSKDKEKFILT